MFLPGKAPSGKEIFSNTARIPTDRQWCRLTLLIKQRPNVSDILGRNKSKEKPALDVALLQNPKASACVPFLGGECTYEWHKISVSAGVQSNYPLSFFSLWLSSMSGEWTNPPLLPWLCMENMKFLYQTILQQIIKEKWNTRVFSIC